VTGPVSTVENDLMPGVTRFVPELFNGAREVKNARIFAGIPFPGRDGRWTGAGTKVANYVLEHALTPVGH